MRTLFGRWMRYLDHNATTRCEPVSSALGREGHRNGNSRLPVFQPRRLRTERYARYLRVRSRGRGMSGSAQDLAGTVPDTSTETSTAGKQRAAGEALLRRMNSPRRLPASVVWFRGSSMVREVSVGTLNPAPAGTHRRPPKAHPHREPSQEPFKRLLGPFCASSRAASVHGHTMPVVCVGRSRTIHGPDRRLSPRPLRRDRPHR